MASKKEKELEDLLAWALDLMLNRPDDMYEPEEGESTEELNRFARIAMRQIGVEDQEDLKARR